MKEMISKIILDHLRAADIKQAIERHVIERLKGIDIDELAEAVIDDVGIFEEVVLEAVEKIVRS